MIKRQLLFHLLLLASITCSAQYKLDTLHYAGDSKYYLDIVYLGDGFMANEPKEQREQNKP